MNKLKIVLLVSSLLLLAGCYHVDQKVKKMTKVKDIITAMEQNDYLTNYDSIEAIEIDERIKIVDGVEVFIQHALLIKGREVEGSAEKQDQLLLLYAIHNPDSKKAIELYANLDLLFLNDFSDSDTRVKIDMCEIKPGLFCKLRQGPYTLQIADVQVDEAFIDSVTTKEIEIDVTFYYKIEENASSLFFRNLKDYRDPESMTTTLQIDFSDVDYSHAPTP